MEKTNKCSVQFICHGNQGICKYFETVDLLDYPYHVCKFEADGHCTCKEAQEEAE